jgi:cell division protein FtsZ
LFEGRKRMRQADEGIAEMAKHVDTMIVVPNERLLAVVGKGIPFQDALKKADEVLLQATGGISGIITKAGMVNVDFADVRTIMKDGGSAIMGTGVGRGENRALDAARIAIESPLLDNVSIAGARGVLINITGGSEMTLDEVTTIASTVKDAVGEDAEIIFGSVTEPAMQGEVRVTVIATGFSKRAMSQPPIIGSRASSGSTPVIPLDPASRAPRSVVPGSPGNAVPAARPRPSASRPMEDLSDLEIPTFIRRQMD